MKKQISSEAQARLNDPEAFATYYFGPGAKEEDDPDCVYELADVHLEMHHALQTEDMLWFLLPREHGKTSTVKHDLIRDICLRPNGATLYGSDTAGNAAKMINAVKFELEHNERLIEDYGPFKPQKAGRDSNYPWSSEGLSVVRTSGRREPTLMGLGVGGSATGLRFDRAILDDIVNQKDKSDTVKANTRHFVKVIIPPLVNRKHGRIVGMGTIWYDDCIYVELMEEGEYTVILKAVHDDAACTGKHEGIYKEPCMLWNTKGGWTYAYLMKKKRMMNDTINFYRQYYNKPQGDREIFPLDSLEGCKDWNRKFYEKDDKWRTFATFDPAGMGKDKQKASYYVAATWGIDPDNPEYDHLIDIDRDRIPPTTQIDRVVSMVEKWNPDALIVEANALQSHIVLTLKARLPGVRVIAHYTGKKNKQLLENSQPYELERSLPARVESGNLRIPWGDDPGSLARKKAQDFIDEFVMYQGEESRNDQIMNWFFLRTNISKFLRRKKTENTYRPKSFVGSARV